MKAFRIILGLVIVGLLGFGIYKVFIDCEKVTSFYDRYFTLSEMDYAVVEDEVTVKLLDIKNSEDEGQYIVKLLVLNASKIAYVELGSVDPLTVQIDKLNLEYTINLIRVDESAVTLTVTPNSEE